ncbi:rho guanine nucleotide exchange factor 17 [Neosynchiropus ocellatus]
MAEREEKKSAAVYRSVSFQKVGSWSADRAGLEAALPPEPPPARVVSVSRKVSKISATTSAASAGLPTADPKKSSSTPLCSISPSIRQLTEKFSSEKTHSVPPGDGAPAPGRSGTLPRVRPTRGDLSPARQSAREDPTAGDLKEGFDKKSLSGTDSFSGSDSERKLCRPSPDSSKSGKRDYTEVNADTRRTVTTDEEDDVFTRGAPPPCKSHRSFHHSDFIPLNPDKWPSVTKIRQIFDERQLRSSLPCESLKPRPHCELQDPSGGALLTCCSPSQSLHAGGAAVETFCDGVTDHLRHEDSLGLGDPKDSSSVCSLDDRTPDTASTCKVQSSSRSVNPDLQPSTASLRSTFPNQDTFSCSSPVQQSTVRERRVRQGVGLPRDSLHSSHSSSRVQAPTSSLFCAPAPDKAITSSATVPSPAYVKTPVRISSSIKSRWRFSSGDEEEEHLKRRAAAISGVPILRTKNGRLGSKFVGRSSGSEDDSPGSLGPSGKESVRRRSLRKKKRVSGVGLSSSRDNDHNSESEDSECDSALNMEHLERQRSSGGDLGFKLSRSHSAREPCSYSSKARVLQQWERMSAPLAPKTLPGVSRVSKVNIPSFASSPVDSRCSSQYSSTETLKGEDQTGSTRSAVKANDGAGRSNNRVASASMLSKTYHGNFTMYRSPSFGHGDNFSRTPVRVVPKMVPAMTPPVGVSGRKAGDIETVRNPGDVHNKCENRISVSNPDIASETMTLLNFIKSDLSDLKVRKTSEGDSSGSVEAGTHAASGRRPSLKDLTATLRRAKSFTYSGKPAAPVRCYLTTGATKRSSSEQQLDLGGELNGARASASEREVESDGGDLRVRRGQRLRSYGYDDDDDEEEVMPTPLQERYVQEARQVIQDICQMSSRDADEDVEIRAVNDLKHVSVAAGGARNEANENRSVADDAEADQKAELRTTEDEGKHVRERETRESERDGQSIHSKKLNSQETKSTKAHRGETLKDLQESVFYDRTVDELSGHESSLTDEGIVTEPETVPSDPCERFISGSSSANMGSQMTWDVLGQPVTAWKQSALHSVELCEEEGQDSKKSSCNSANEFDVSSSRAARTVENNNVAESTSLGMITADEETSLITCGIQGSTALTGVGEASGTPSTARRRRKFSPPGNNNMGSDFSNNSDAESTMGAGGNGESTVYRSLSDPMPQRFCSVPQEGSFSSVDSNLLGSLNVKGGAASESSAEATLPEYKGSVSSDLSGYSDGGHRDDGIHDYSGVIRSIVAEPGAMDRLMVDDHTNGKTHKKKSFSDPSRRSDAPLLSKAETHLKGEAGGAEPVGELDQSGQIPPSISEPILNEQREDGVGTEPKLMLPTHMNHCQHGNSKKQRSISESDPHSGSKEEKESRRFNFDFKLAEVLSPRMVRRPGRKRPTRLAHFFPHEDPFEPPEFGLDEQEHNSDPNDLTPPLPPPPNKSKTRPKHVRHASEPAAFLPISPPVQPFSTKEGTSPGVPSILIKPSVDEAPSLEDVTQKYFLMGSPEPEPDSEGPGPSLDRDGAPLTASEGPTDAAVPAEKKTTEETPSTPTAERTKPKVDMRKHVMMTLLDTEQSYVESLRTLTQGYMRPLKQPDGGSIVDPLLVDEMFYQIPEILEHHEHFLDEISRCVSQWHDRQTIGHLFTQSFSKEDLANMYSAYIDNFLNAKDAVRIAKEAKPAFHKFLEQNMRENKEKQALGDLMIKPVQRIPRYELIVKDLLKHTPEDHPDHSFLLDAQRDIKRLAEKINKGRRSAEEAEREARVIQEIEAHIEGIEHILNPQRKFLRQEMVMEAKTVGGKKDRSLFLFSDLIICTTLKRKSGSLRRSSMSLYSAASVIDTSSKYKFLWKLPLEDVEVVKNSTQTTNRENIQKTISRLDEDLSTLGQISKLSESLSFPHQSLDESLKDLMTSVHRELSEKQSLAFSMTFLPTKLEFTTVSAESSFVFEFSSPDVRSNFEQAFEEAKKKLAMTKDQWDPEFLKAIPIMKTRSGMQFSCASPSHSCPDSGCEVWVCNSDGYVGQVCLLNIKDEPTVEACIAVCSARIICIAAVPGLKARERGSEPAPAPVPATHNQQQLHISISHSSSLELTEQPMGPGAELVPFDSDDTDDEDSPSPSSTLQSQASHSTISSSYGNEDGPSSKDLNTETTSSEEEQEYPVASSYTSPGMLSVSAAGRGHAESPMDGRAMRRSSRGSFTRASLEDLLSIDPEAYQSSVWLGTEDGCIHVYQSSDNIRNRKNSMKMQHAASILCILYWDNKVFVSLANGEVIVYQREAGSFWDAQTSQTLVLGTPSSPVTKMVPVGGKLWCGVQNKVLIINSTSLVQEHWFQVGTDSSRCVTCLVAYGQGVWLALQGSAHVKLYHAQTWESLTEVDVAPAVHKMLAGADAIIRQHKAACLRITALLACKDLLWIGTSAGVVLTLAIPAVSSGTGAGTIKSPLQPMGSAHGHTGHVRFLTSIELPEGLGMNFPMATPEPAGNQSQSSGAVDGHLQRRDSARSRASAHLPPKTNHLVISGGDGYEDFRLTSSSETVGRDDSTNHLLLWRV